MGYLIASFWLPMLLSAVIGMATGAWVWRRPAQAASAADLVYPAAGSSVAASEPQAAEAAEEPQPDPEPEPEAAPAEPESAEAEPELETEPEPDTPPSPFLTEPDGDPDNLTLIKGVGPKLADMLHDLGVFHFAQIADWGEHQVTEVDSQLGSFRGRIERDRWVDQARLLNARNVAAFEREFGKMNGPL
ncbi:hypothetical protein [Parasphingopyxis sp.]|uniref:hypothetical protein n=1 Tax=Parasphingopyxis sp. TaxID=1920299 RepID=UPI0026264B2A|nr:hypothetical protein [Parasphingopyxis sp.]